MFLLVLFVLRQPHQIASKTDRDVWRSIERMHLAERLQNDKKRAWERWGKGRCAGGFTMLGVEKEWNRDQGYVAGTRDNR